MNQNNDTIFSREQSLLVLLVEDNMINQKLITSALVRAGHRVDNASNGQIAVDKFRENTYDVILMDIMMPVMDGITACKTIREVERERGISRKQGIKIIAVTANAFEDDRDDLLAAGMDDMLNKPVDIEELKRILTP